MRKMEPIDPLLSLRGFACLAIIWFHLRPTTWLIVHGVNLSFLTAPSGALAVYIFYLLSGYTIGYGFFSRKYTLTLPSLRIFYTNRFLRIAPAYYVCVLLSIFVFYPGVRVTFYDIVRFGTFTANFDYFSLPFQHLIAVISTEMQFYLAAPILFALLSFFIRRLHPFITGISILLLGITIRFILQSAGLVTDLPSYMLHAYVTVWGMVDYFLFGMYLSYLACKRPEVIIQLKKHFPAIAFYAVLTVWFLWINYGNFFALPWPTYALYHMYIIPPTLCVLIGWYILSGGSARNAAYQQTTVWRILRLLTQPNTFLTGVGTISYGLFLYHLLFFDVLYRLPDRIAVGMPAFISRFIVVLVLTMFMALVSFHFIEYPFLLKKRK